VTFRSLQEEMEWVEDRRRMRQKRLSKFDVLPTAEQLQQQLQLQQQALAGMSATGSASATTMAPLAVGVPSSTAAMMNSQQTRHARRLYIGNLPPLVSEDQIHSRFRQAIAVAMGQPEHSLDPPEADPILSVYINHERRFCFLEFKTIEMTTACMQLDGLDLLGTKVKIKRPNDYNELTAPKPVQLLQLDVSRLGIISNTVVDGPNKIFIGGLHYHLQPEQILELLQAFGKVKAFHLVRNTDNVDGSAGTSKGYCFVEYADPAVTPIAIQGLNGMDIGGGKSLTARLAGDRSGVMTAGVMMAASGTDAASPTNALTVSPGAGAAAATIPGAPPPDRTIVTGYDVEELVDAAMGQKPMPTAPVYLDAMGIPLTRIVPFALTIANAVQAAQEAAASAATWRAASPHALQQTSAPALHTNGSTSNSIPTRVLVLHNMVTDEDLSTDDDYNGLLEEVRDECAKYGQLHNIQIPRLQQPGRGKIFLEYATAADAAKASGELAGRQFGNSYVETSYYSEEDFRKGHFQ